MLALAACFAVPAQAGAQSDADPGPQAGGPAVVVAVLPFATTVEQLGSVDGMAPGVVSAGLGPVPLSQTFLDIGQGNRVNESLYGGPLPPLYVRDGRVPPPLWDEVTARADRAPAQVVPGLLASTLSDAGVRVAAERDIGLPGLIGVDRDGEVSTAPRGSCCGPGLNVVRVGLGRLRTLAAGLGPDDLLIAIAAGSREQQELLPTGIEGAGFDGNLTSSSTRTDGVVLTTDLAPTILDHLGVDVPSQMNGTEITTSGGIDAGEVADLQVRLDHRPSRDEVVLAPLGIWLVLTALVALIWRGRGARPALRLLGLSVAWAPLLVLALAGPDLDPLPSALVVGLGSPALALATDRLVPGPGGLALACGATVAGYGIDVIAGSPLTALSVLGPNPGAGVRFFGIGNELEAILTTLTMIGAGAFLDTRRSLEPRAAAIWFVAIAVVVVAALAPGRFGADVGAAIVLGVGAATAAVLSLKLPPARAFAYVVGGGVLALLALVAVDLVSGGAHLSRTVLGAGDAHNLLDVFDRRLRLMVHTFTHPVYPELLVICALAIVAAIAWRRRVFAWFGERWAARAGWLGAVAGVAVGTVANDSGSVLLVIGTICLGVAAGWFWATGPSATLKRDPY